MRLNRRVHAALAALGLLSLITPGLAWSQQMFVYPQRGQSPQQQARDQGECQAWAVQQTGYNPMMAQAPPPTAAAPQGGVVRGGARGAAVGAVGGAIGGDAGKGAAIGAATGALLGGMRRRDQQRQVAAQEQAYESQNAQLQANFNRAVGACLSGRGYTVQ